MGGRGKPVSIVRPCLKIKKRKKKKREKKRILWNILEKRQMSQCDHCKPNIKRVASKGVLATPRFERLCFLRKSRRNKSDLISP